MMKKKMSLKTVMATVAFVCAVSASLLPAHAAQFTADMAITGPGANYSYKLYVKDTMYRLEKDLGGMQIPPFPTIVNQETGVTLCLNPQERQYTETTKVEETMMMNPIAGWKWARKDWQKSLGGNEMINGYACTKAVYAEPGSSRIEAAVWESPKLGFFVKQVQYAQNGDAVMELKNIKEGPVDPALFQIPKGYTKAEGSGNPQTSKTKTATASATTPQTTTSPPRTGGNPDTQAKAGGARSNLIFILDASGSMWGQIEGTPKIAIAKEVLTGLIKDLPDDVYVGLVAYGHRRKGDCKDVEELVPLSPIDKKKLMAKIQEINPKGKTPITLSVQMTADKIKVLEDETTIILVSDGKETCEGDPCALVKKLKALGIKFVMHVIGFDVTEEERTQLECMAKAGGGEYFTAKTAGQFKMAAEKVVEKAQNFGYLRVTALKNQKPFRATLEITRPGQTGAFVTTATVTEEKEKGSKLEPGTYDIRVIDAQVQTKPAVTVTGIVIELGKTAERTVDFSGGTLKVAAVKNNKPSFARIYVNKAGTETRVASSDTSSTNPQTIQLQPGTYDVLVVDENVSPKQTIPFRNLAIQNGQVIEKKADFTEGYLTVRIFKNGTESHGECVIYDAGRTTRLAGVTGKSPHTYKLMPGIYQVDVKDGNIFPNPTVTFENVQIQGNQTVEKKAEFTPGYLQITAKRSGQVVEASAAIYDAATNMRVRGANTKANPTVELMPGCYNVTFIDDWGTKKKKMVNGITIEAGQTQSISADFITSPDIQNMGGVAEAPAGAPKTTPPPEPKPAETASQGSTGPATTAQGSKMVEEPAEQQDEIFGGAVPIYPGAEVTKTSTIGSMTKVELLTQDSPEAVVNFYKEAMTKKGWNVLTSVARGNTATAAFQKGSSQLVIGAQRRDIGTVVSITMK
ncbi:MAG: VWA domain-containing protein [Deltaproteobacteria bacterium]|nr:VWA domain-containing protein [Deltaproteobacteria bacterium]